MYSYKKREADSPAAKKAEPSAPFAGGMPSLTEGASRKELPDAMRTKMENAFGADFSSLNIVESEKVAEGGAKAVTQGNTIAFAPGEFNVYSPSSEALLGHELSHVVSQARGESRGSGLLTDSYLEAKADREGVMAAAGQQVYSGPVTPLSGSSPMSVAGPMQCKKNNENSNSNLHNGVTRDEGGTLRSKDNRVLNPEGNVQDYLLAYGTDYQNKPTFGDAHKEYKRWLKANNLKGSGGGSKGFHADKIAAEGRKDVSDLLRERTEIQNELKKKKRKK